MCPGSGRDSGGGEKGPPRQLAALRLRIDLSSARRVKMSRECIHDKTGRAFKRRMSRSRSGVAGGREFAESFRAECLAAVPEMLDYLLEALAQM